MSKTLADLTVKVFADGADVANIVKLAQDPVVQGFTTNPTLMRQSGVSDYERFAHTVLPHLKGLPISFEVFSDDFDEMYRQALHIAQWGPNVYVKIPITDTRGNTSVPLLHSLVRNGVQVNVTAIMTTAQVEPVADLLKGAPPAYVSVFAGRIADTGLDPLPIMRQSLRLLENCPRAELIWASPREVYNIVQADDIGCHVITVTYDLLKKLKTLGKDLEQFSLETVQMFYHDACSAGFSLPTGAVAAAASASR